MARKANKANKAESAKRVKDIAQMLIEGKSTAYIIQYCSENYQIGERQAANYIAKAEQAIIEMTSKDFEKNFSLVTQRYHDLYQKCYKEKKYGLCRNINKDLSELWELSKLRIEHTATIEATVNTKSFKNMSEEELTEELTRLDKLLAEEMEKAKKENKAK